MTDGDRTHSAGKVLVEPTIAAPAEAVWRSLREPGEIERWFGWDAPTLADEIQYIFVEHAAADDATMTLHWPGRNDAIEVVPRGQSCLVRLVRAGAAGNETDWDGVYEDETEGWLAFLTQLQFALERHPGEPRRTIYLAGAPTAGAPATFPRESLGLGNLPHTTGDSYEAELPPGDLARGCVWARSRRQLAITVDHWGDGLLLVTDRSRSGRTPDGGGSVTLTTYQMADPAFEDLVERWTRWWLTHFPKRYDPSSGGSEGGANAEPR